MQGKLLRRRAARITSCAPLISVEDGVAHSSFCVVVVFSYTVKKGLSVSQLRHGSMDKTNRQFYAFLILGRLIFPAVSAETPVIPEDRRPVEVTPVEPLAS